MKGGKVVDKERDSEKLQPVFDLAIEGRLDPGDRDKVATSIIWAYTRLKATEIHGDALKYQVIKDLSQDREELRKYIDVSMPEIKKLKK